MIHVSLSIEYRGIPFSIEIDSQTPDSFDLDTLGRILENVKIFIDKMLESQRT